MTIKCECHRACTWRFSDLRKWWERTIDDDPQKTVIEHCDMPFSLVARHRLDESTRKYEESDANN